ncbi:hypothetical protein QMO56_13580 [Roseomonas sp. E05]|uniref:hypothetical protein n=1 Tax=Roseomonas sp. E05 TaxID=3046310 RepID=UPI0024BA36E2|nr:hypothetical protein [Roseomonas sp. E05]MDJ0389148.1 hypothetical protein [Roseomonas sp. E05]
MLAAGLGIASVAGEIRQERHSALAMACMPAMAPVLPSILQGFSRRHSECRVAVHGLHARQAGTALSPMTESFLLISGEAFSQRDDIVMPDAEEKA